MSAKILVADESPTIHKIVAMAFENEGMKVEGISKGEHVLEYMVEFNPDIVLADIHLPGVDGYELSRQIKGMDRFSSVRVVLLTSDFEDVDEEELKNSLADDTISKPFKSEEILKKIKSNLQRAEPKEVLPALEMESAPEKESNQVIQNEFEDIVNRGTESLEDTVKELFPDNEKPAQIELPPKEDDAEKTETPKEKAATEPVRGEESQPVAAEGENADESGEAERQDDSRRAETPAPRYSETPEEVFRPETRPVMAPSEDLDAVFQAVLAAPESVPEDTDADAPQREPGTKPNLIEEALSLMARHPIKEEPAPEPATGNASRETRDAPDLSLGHRVVEAHMDQVKERLAEDAGSVKDSAALEKTVREVLGELAPEIIRKVIRKEIENIKKTKEV